MCHRVLEKRFFFPCSVFWEIYSHSDRCSNSTISSDYDMQKLPVAKAPFSQIEDMGIFIHSKSWIM